MVEICHESSKLMSAECRLIWRFCRTDEAVSRGGSNSADSNTPLVGACPFLPSNKGKLVTQYACPLTRHTDVPSVGKPDPAKKVVEKEGKRCEPGSRQEAIAVQVASRNGTTLA